MRGDDGAAEPAAWAPVVFGRTYTVDEWWRALPEDVSPDGPVATVLLAAVADGRVPAPRFVLARLPAGTLLGVACSAGRISQMSKDVEGRPLYCFVGWHCADRQAIVPELADVVSGWERWAGDEYDLRMGDVWRKSAGVVRSIDTTVADTPPWTLSGMSQPDAGPGADVPAEFRSPQPDGVWVYPATASALVWHGATRSGANVAIVTGWQSIKAALHPSLTHICADDFSGSPHLVHFRAKDRPKTTPQTSRNDQNQSATTATPGYGAATAGGRWEQSEDKQTSGSGGILGNIVKKVAQGASDFLSYGDSGGQPKHQAPPEPPTWWGAWTFDPAGIFRATSGGYEFRYSIGTPAIRCSHSRHPEEVFQWTDRGWEPASPASAHDSPSGGTAPVPASAEVADDTPDIPMVTPQLPPREELKESFNATFGDFGKKSSRQKPTRPDRDQSTSPDE